MVRRRRFLAGSAFVAAILSSTHTAFAGGLYIQEFATPSMGTADAGSQSPFENSDSG